MHGDIIKDRTPISAYQPPKAVADFTADAKRDYAQGVEILNRSWVELNNYSVIERMNKDQRTFNALVDESVENPAEAWKWRGTRSKARKKALAMHAHLTANYIIPMVGAQNDDDEEDRGMADIARDGLDWMAAYLVGGLHSEAAGNQMQLILSHVLERQLVRRLPKKTC